jgi:hypothetical protein
VHGFPRLEAEDLEGRALELPGDLPPYPVVLLVAFHRHHHTTVDSWCKKLTPFEAAHPDLEVFEVATMPKMYATSKDLIDDGMRSAVSDPCARAHTLSAYTDVGEFARALGLRSLDTVYVYLTGRDGEIRWSEEGEPDPTKLGELAGVLEDPGTSAERA